MASLYVEVRELLAMNPMPRLQEILDRHAPKPKKPPRIYFDFEAVMWRGITRADLALWRDAYPAVDIEQQLRAMKVWIINAGAKGHKSAWGSFITRWLSRAQEKGGMAARIMA